MFRRPESVLVLIYTRQGEVLLLQRADVKDFWQSVTGGLKAEETPAIAATRELLEETGIHASCADRLIDHQRCTSFEIKGVWRKRYHPEHTHNREHLFSIMLNEVEAVSLNVNEHLNYVWLKAEQAYEKASSATNKQAIQNIVINASLTP